jgi:3-hydroxyisobutyrate dehydrogenase-like beta-hydroxyacid dehydrogenase
MREGEPFRTPPLDPTLRVLVMQLGLVGLGWVGASMVRRLLSNGHRCVVFDTAAAAVEELVLEGAVGSSSLSTKTMSCDCHGCRLA